MLGGTYRHTSVKRSIDWWTVLMYVVLAVCGWLSIYSASHDFNNPDVSIFDFNTLAGKQFVWIVTSFVVIVFILLIDYKLFNSLFVNFAYLGIMLLLIVTIFIGEPIKGSRSWIDLGFMSVQPAELAKLITALAVARFIDMRGRIDGWKDYFSLSLLLFIPFIIVIFQNETGTALVFAAFVLVFYREGMSGLVLLLGVFAIILFIALVRFDFWLPEGAVLLECGNVQLNEYEIVSLKTATGKIGDLGKLIAMVLILIAQFFYTLFSHKGSKISSWIMLGGMIAIALTAYVLNFWFTVRYDYVALIAIGATVVYWAAVALVKRSKKLRGLILFILSAVAFSYAVDYVFDEVLLSHQRVRIEVLLNMTEDLSGAGYNVHQSKIAIGSGGLLGQGFLQGTQTKLNYVPEQVTDFIFCTVGEEFGFVGTTLILLLYLTFLLRLLHIAERQRDTFSRVYGYGVVSVFFCHIMINIGMIIGLMPVIGIPLPFFSYGGSSLWTFTAMLFILLRLDASRNERLR